MTTDDLDTDLDEIPDFFDSTRECRARQATRPIIGVPPHTHVCRHAPHTTGPHRCTCGTEY